MDDIISAYEEYLTLPQELRNDLPFFGNSEVAMMEPLIQQTISLKERGESISKGSMFQNKKERHNISTGDISRSLYDESSAITDQPIIDPKESKNQICIEKKVEHMTLHDDLKIEEHVEGCEQVIRYDTEISVCIPNLHHELPLFESPLNVQALGEVGMIEYTLSGSATRVIPTLLMGEKFTSANNAHIKGQSIMEISKTTRSNQGMGSSDVTSIVSLPFHHIGMGSNGGHKDNSEIPAGSDPSGLVKFDLSFQNKEVIAVHTYSRPAMEEDHEVEDSTYYFDGGGDHEEVKLEGGPLKKIKSDALKIDTEGNNKCLENEHLQLKHPSQRIGDGAIVVGSNNLSLPSDKDMSWAHTGIPVDWKQARSLQSVFGHCLTLLGPSLSQQLPPVTTEESVREKCLKLVKRKSVDTSCLESPKSNKDCGGPAVSIQNGNVINQSCEDLGVTGKIGLCVPETPYVLEDTKPLNSSCMLKDTKVNFGGIMNNKEGTAYGPILSDFTGYLREVGGSHNEHGETSETCIKKLVVNWGNLPQVLPLIKQADKKRKKIKLSAGGDVSSLAKHDHLELVDELHTERKDSNSKSSSSEMHVVSNLQICGGTCKDSGLSFGIAVTDCGLGMESQTLCAEASNEERTYCDTFIPGASEKTMLSDAVLSCTDSEFENTMRVSKMDRTGGGPPLTKLCHDKEMSFIQAVNVLQVSKVGCTDPGGAGIEQKLYKSKLCESTDKDCAVIEFVVPDSFEDEEYLRDNSKRDSYVGELQASFKSHNLTVINAEADPEALGKPSVILEEVNDVQKFGCSIDNMESDLRRNNSLCCSRESDVIEDTIMSKSVDYEAVGGISINDGYSNSLSTQVTGFDEFNPHKSTKGESIAVLDHSTMALVLDQRHGEGDEFVNALHASIYQTEQMAKCECNEEDLSILNYKENLRNEKSHCLDCECKAAQSCGLQDQDSVPLWVSGPGKTNSISCEDFKSASCCQSIRVDSLSTELKGFFLVSTYSDMPPSIVKPQTVLKSNYSEDVCPNQDIHINTQQGTYENKQDLWSTELVGCYEHSIPVISMVLSVHGADIHLCVVCGVTQERERSLFIYKVVVGDASGDCSWLIGYTVAIFPDVEYYFDTKKFLFLGQSTLDRYGIQLTPDGENLILLESIKVQNMREPRMNCLQSQCLSQGQCKGHGVKLISVKDAHVSVLTMLSSTESMYCILVSASQSIIAAGENGIVHVWNMDTSWSKCLEEFVLASAGHTSSIWELLAVPHLSHLIIGHDCSGCYVIWDISRRVMLSNFWSVDYNIFQSIALGCVRQNGHDNMGWSFTDCELLDKAKNHKDLKDNMVSREEEESKMGVNKFPFLHADFCEENIAVCLLVLAAPYKDEIHRNQDEYYEGLKQRGLWRFALLKNNALLVRTLSSIIWDPGGWWTGTYGLLL